MRFPVALTITGLSAVCFGQFGGRTGNPFAPPAATLHYAPDRTCDLIHLRVDLSVDVPSRTFTGRSENTLVPLRDGIRQVKLMAGTALSIKDITLDGSKTVYERKGRDLMIDTPPLTKGHQIIIAIDYSESNSRGGSFGFGGGGFHWIGSRPGMPNRIGFWTQGETDLNSDWAPTWDYPNDLTTSETHCTVPADWTVIGNGVLKSNTLLSGGAKRTFVWQMDLPHATYLLSLAAGPFDVKTDRWRGVPLMYVVPKGEGSFADYTFSGTKDMLSFYSDTLGFKYPWPKYAQDAMYDFGGGMENVSATTMTESALTEPREGFRRSDSLISHEMAHQWFGDTVTCYDWGDIWLNESFATFMQMMYFEHSRGKNGYDQEVDNNTRSYLNEARRYKRAISTKLYESPDSMFDSHTYPKGGVVLHTLRRELRDGPFFAGLNLYLRSHEHTPVQTSQLCRSMTEATGIDCQPFFDQWILKPGHPVLDYTWTPSPEGKGVLLTVNQIQDTSDGTPIYDIPAKVVVISGGKLSRYPIHLKNKTDRFELVLPDRPDAVILDGDHDFLREIPDLHWSHDEMVAIVKWGPEGGDRSLAIRELLEKSPSEADIQVVSDAIRQDDSDFPALTDLNVFWSLKREELRPLFTSLLTDLNFQRRADAVYALGQLSPTPETENKLRSLISGREPIAVVTRSIQALSNWGGADNVELFKKALTIPSRNDRIKQAAQEAIGAAAAKK
jgi:aminopeptidase N